MEKEKKSLILRESWQPSLLLVFFKKGITQCDEGLEFKAINLAQLPTFSSECSSRPA